MQRLIKALISRRAPRVIRLTLSFLLLSVFASGCSYLGISSKPICKSHAYIKTTLPDYISARFNSQSPVRLGIIPFSVPSNLTTVNPESPGLEHQLAWRLHSELLDFEELPIVEVLPREDWPGKRDEFFAGNFGALRFGRDSGYDIVLVGMLEPIHSSNQFAAYGKVMDTASGVTLWYGKVTVDAPDVEWRDVGELVGTSSPRPDRNNPKELLGKLARCMAQAVMVGKPK